MQLHTPASTCARSICRRGASQRAIAIPRTRRPYSASPISTDLYAAIALDASHRLASTLCAPFHIRTNNDRRLRRRWICMPSTAASPERKARDDPSAQPALGRRTRRTIWANPNRILELRHRRNRRERPARLPVRRWLRPAVAETTVESKETVGRGSRAPCALRAIIRCRLTHKLTRLGSRPRCGRNHNPQGQ